MGEVNNPLCRRLYAIMTQSRNKSEAFAAEAKLSVDDSETKRLNEESVRCNYYADLIKELFWLQQLHDLGRWIDHVGVRQGWKLVECQHHNPLSFLFGGGQ